MAKLHVFTGDAAADTVRAALGIPDGGFLVQHDVISCGPAQAFKSREEWSRARADFWKTATGWPELPGFPNDLVDDAGRIPGAERLTLWVGAGLSDRLLLPSVIALCHL